MPPTTSNRADGSEHPPTPPPLGRRELVVVASPGAGLRTSGAGLTSSAGTDTGSLEGVLARHGAQMQPLFGPSEERVAAAVANLPSTENLPDLNLFYNVTADDDALDRLAEDLLVEPLVDAAYVKPAATT